MATGRASSGSRWRSSRSDGRAEDAIHHPLSVASEPSLILRARRWHGEVDQQLVFEQRLKRPREVADTVHVERGGRRFLETASVGQGAAKRVRRGIDGAEHGIVS